MLESRALERFYRDESLLGFLASVVDGADVGVVERGGGLRLSPEAGQSLWIEGYIVGQKLERYEAAKPRIFGLVHNSHPAADSVQNPIVRDSLPDHWAEI